jgi:hypothetical protein
MMTQTPLSAVRSARREEKLPTRPGVSAAARSSSFQPQASSLQNLIANLELEFQSTHRKISPLKISNRKYFAIFHLTSQSRRPVSPNFQNGNPFGAIPLAQLHPRKPLTSPRAALRISSLRFSPTTGHSSLVTALLIYGSAMRNPRKALKT